MCAMPIARCISGMILLALVGLLLAAGAPRPQCVVCRAELYSWTVSRPHPGRHLYLQIECPAEYEHLNGRVEYTSAMLRRDYRPTTGPDSEPRVIRMTRGAHLVPYIGDAEATRRLEAFYLITPAQAACLQRDRMYERAYSLLGPNSTSGMLAALRACGCAIPNHIATKGGWINEFPGAEMSPGRELRPDEWAQYGIATGPTPVPQRGSRAAGDRSLIRHQITR